MNSKINDSDLEALNFHDDETQIWLTYTMTHVWPYLDEFSEELPEKLGATKGT